jgi:hypothetical protein
VHTQTQPACGVARPSKLCVSVNDDWYCPPGSSCGSAYGSCFGGGGGSCVAEGGGASPTTPPDSSSSDSSGGGGTSGSGSGNESGVSGTPASAKNDAGGWFYGDYKHLGMLLMMELGVLFVMVACL